MTTRRRTNNTGWVRQLPSRRWQAKFPGPDGQLRPAPQTFDTKADAEAWLTVQRQQVAGGTWTATTTIKGTFRAYAEQWMASRALKPTSRNDYTRMLDNHILPRFGDVALEAITVESVKQWHATLLVDSPASRARTYSVLRTILGTAYSDDLIPGNPCRIRGAGQTPRSTTIEVPTAVEVHALADAMGSEKFRIMLLVSAWVGTRFGETTELRRKDVVCLDGVPVEIRVRRGVVRVKGQFIVGTPKSRAGIRDVSIPPHIRQDLADYLATIGSGPETLLFFGIHPDKHIGRSGIDRSFRKAKAAVGLPNLRWHDLRHFSATTAAGTGASLAELQHRLGHSTVSAAMRYQHAASSRDAEIADAMSNVIPLRSKGA